MTDIKQALTAQLADLRRKLEQVDGSEIAGLGVACREEVLQSISMDFCKWLSHLLIAEDLRRQDEPHQHPLPDFRALNASELAGFMVASRTLARNALSARAEDLLWAVNDIALGNVLSRLRDAEDRSAAVERN